MLARRAEQRAVRTERGVLLQRLATRRPEERRVQREIVAESGADGSFRLEVPAGYYDLDAAHPDFAGPALADGARPNVMVYPQMDTAVELMLARGCIIEGRAIHADGGVRWVSAELQPLVAEGGARKGVLVLARATDPKTGKSVLHGRRTTCLPKYMEKIAYYLTAWKHGRYYRTYDAYVEEEVVAALEDPSHFERGPFTLMKHGGASDDTGAFVVEDGNYISARWPGDAFLLAKKLLARLG